MKKNFLLKMFIAAAMLPLAAALQAQTSISLSDLAGSIMTTSKSYGYMPEAFGKGASFTITSDLVCVRALSNNLLVAHDNARCAEQWYSHPDNLEWALDYVDKVTPYDEVADFLQNNWVTIELPAGLDAHNYVGATLAGGTVTGTIDMSGTFDIKLTATRMPNPPNATSDNVDMNTYTMANFSYEDGVFCNKNLWNSSRPAFFVVPKPGEVAKIKWATYNQGAMTVTTQPQDALHNALGYQGSGSLDFSYLNYKDKTGAEAGAELTDGNTYDMVALINTRGEEIDGVIQAAPRRRAGGESIPTVFQHDFDFNGYVIYPLEILAEYLPTAVEQVKSEPVATGVSYYNLAGMRLAAPGAGVTLVVTTLSDGTRRVTKVMR